MARLSSLTRQNETSFRPAGSFHAMLGCAIKDASESPHSLQECWYAIFWVLRSGAPWRDLPERYGPRTTCYNRFVRWRKAGFWDRLMDAITKAHDGRLQMIDTSIVRVHQQGATAKRGDRDHCLGRSQVG
jgi:transposase